MAAVTTLDDAGLVLASMLELLAVGLHDDENAETVSVARGTKVRVLHAVEIYRQAVLVDRVARVIHQHLLTD